jgi:hypothetical protein
MLASARCTDFGLSSPSVGVNGVCAGQIDICQPHVVVAAGTARQDLMQRDINPGHGLINIAHNLSAEGAWVAFLVWVAVRTW